MRQGQANKLGDHLRAARQELGLSTREVGRRAGVDMATIVRLENGSLASPKADTLRSVATALSLDVSETYALSGYLPASDLPTFTPYLRAKYGPNLPPDAIDQLQRSFERIAKKHGYDPAGPQPGADE